MRRVSIGAIVLAGGAGSRLGGVDKATLELDGVALLDRALAALDGLPVVVVGPPRQGLRATGSAAAQPMLADAPNAGDRTDHAAPSRDGAGADVGVLTIQEFPVRSGPASAVVAGLGALPHAAEVLLLAIDVLRLPEALPHLLAAPAGRDGVIAVDGDGRDQWLLGRYRLDALRAAAALLDAPAGRSMRALLGGLDLARIRLPDALEADVDTVADAERAGVALPAGGGAMSDDVGATLDDWWATLTAALGLETVPADRDAILTLAGDAAHAVVRPAAPITTFLAGYAAGLAGGSRADISSAIERAAAATGR